MMNPVFIKSALEKFRSRAYS